MGNLSRGEALIGLALAFDLDSFDVEEACRRHGLDYDVSPVAEIRGALLADYGGKPPVFPVVRWARTDDAIRRAQ